MATKADIETILNLITSGDIESLKAEEFEIFQYQGFDPLQIAGALFSIKKSKSIEDGSFMNDVYRMVAIGIIKGSVTEKNLGKMTDAGQTGVKDLMSRYGIALGGGRGQNSKVITFPRVMATFPDVAVRMTGVIGGKEFRGGPFNSSVLPHYMQIQVFPAIIPRTLNGKVKRFLLTASLCYSIDQSIQISQISSPDLKKLAADQGNFVNVGHNSPLPSAESRVTTFKSLNVNEEYDEIKAVVELYKSLVDDSIVVPGAAEFKNAIDKV